MRNSEFPADETRVIPCKIGGNGAVMVLGEKRAINVCSFFDFSEKACLERDGAVCPVDTYIAQNYTRIFEEVL